MKRKTRNVFLVVGVIAISTLLLFVVFMNKTADNLHQFTYASYVSLEYVPRYKKEFGKWPSDLKGLPAYLITKKRDTEAHYVKERLNLVYEFHKTNYENFVPLKIHGSRYYYKIIIKGDELKCSSDEKSGYCE